MRDALTIVVVHISRQQDEPLLDVDQGFCLQAGADFLQRINEPGHFVGPDPTVQREPIEPGHLSPFVDLVGVGNESTLPSLRSAFIV
jgi:hypothetical protein